MPGVEFCCQGPVEGKNLESVESESISSATKKNDERSNFVKFPVEGVSVAGSWTGWTALPLDRFEVKASY